MTDYNKYQSKITRGQAYEFYLKWISQDKPSTVTAKARELGAYPRALSRKMKKIAECISLDEKKVDGHQKHLENYLTYQRKTKHSCSISIWSPDHPKKKQLSLPDV